MKGAFIKAVEYYLPERVLTNEDISSRFPEWDADKISKKLGIEERHIAGIDETALDMAEKSCKKLFAHSTNLRNEIDFVILCSQSVDYKLPSSSCILQQRLGLRTSCGALDINLGCSGYVYGLSLAKGLIVSGIAHNVLLVTAETYSKYIHPSDKGNITIFGDASTATIISDEGFAEIGGFVLGSDGSGAEKLIVKTGGAKEPNTSGRFYINEDGTEHRDDFLFMDGKAIFDFSAEKVPQAVGEILDKEKLSKSDVNLWIFHQANKYMINYLRKELEIDPERFFVYMEKVGNTVSSTIPIALVEAQKQGLLKGNVILVGFGVGLSWGATLLRL